MSQRYVCTEAMVFDEHVDMVRQGSRWFRDPHAQERSITSMPVRLVSLEPRRQDFLGIDEADLAEHFEEELVDCTNTLLREIAQGLSVDDLAKTYALAIRSSEPTDWMAVNYAIYGRMGEAALAEIKRQAWQILDSYEGLPPAPCLD